MLKGIAFQLFHRHVCLSLKSTESGTSYNSHMDLVISSMQIPYYHTLLVYEAETETIETSLQSTFHLIVQPWGRSKSWTASRTVCNFCF